MDRATLLQIFQSRLERSDYPKLQKIGKGVLSGGKKAGQHNTQTLFQSFSTFFLWFFGGTLWGVKTALLCASRLALRAHRCGRGFFFKFVGVLRDGEGEDVIMCVLEINNDEKTYGECHY